jgi:hypothetical protein
VTKINNPLLFDALLHFSMFGKGCTKKEKGGKSHTRTTCTWRRRCMNVSLYDIINSLVFRQQQGEYEEEKVYESLYDIINSLVFRQQQGGV